MILVYVNDIIITGDSKRHTQTLIQHLNQFFPLKDLGEMHYFLEIEVNHTTNGIFLNQGKYIKDLLARAQMTDAKGM